MRRPVRRRARDDAVGTTRSSRSSVATASWCPSTGEPSGIATTTCSASCCATSSSAASRTSCPSSTVGRWPGASPTTCRKRRSSTGTRRVRRTPSPAWSTPLRCRSTTTAEWRPWRSGWGGSAMTSCVRYPALAVYGAWVRALTGRPADAERWLGLADGATSTLPLSDGSATIEPWVATLRACMMPDGVEQALADADLALDQLSPDSGWIPDALLVRGVAHALLGATDRATDDLTAAVETGTGRRRRRGSSSWHRHSSRSSRPSREPGARQGNAHGRHKRSSRRRAWATTRRARSRTWRRRASRSTRRDRRMRARR